MDTKLNSRETVLFDYTKKFHTDNGKSESEAIELANEKILKTRKLAKTLKFRY